MTVPRSPLDRLTDLERRLVQARISHPQASHRELAKLAKISRGDDVRRVLMRPQVRAALLIPPPTVTEERVNFLSLSPIDQKKWLLGWYVKLVENAETPQSERIRALGAISEMIPGAKVPVGVHHTGTWNLEQFVAAAGGKPEGVHLREEVPN